jgi:hypothetical protein
MTKFPSVMNNRPPPLDNYQGVTVSGVMGELHWRDGKLEVRKSTPKKSRTPAAASRKKTRKSLKRGNPPNPDNLLHRRHSLPPDKGGSRGVLRWVDLHQALIDDSNAANPSPALPLSGEGVRTCFILRSSKKCFSIEK